MNLDYAQTREESTSIVYAVFRMYEDGHLKVRVIPPYESGDVAIAQFDLQGWKNSGKLLFAIDD